MIMNRLAVTWQLFSCQEYPAFINRESVLFKTISVLLVEKDSWKFNKTSLICENVSTYTSWLFDD